MTTPKRTGLLCPACRQPVAIIARETDDAITLKCEACGHRWSVAKTMGPIAFDSNVLTFSILEWRCVVERGEKPSLSC